MNQEQRIRRLEDHAQLMEKLVTKQTKVLHELMDYIKLIDVSVHEKLDKE